MLVRCARRSLVLLLVAGLALLLSAGLTACSERAEPSAPPPPAVATPCAYAHRHRDAHSATRRPAPSPTASPAPTAPATPSPTPTPTATPSPDADRDAHASSHRGALDQRPLLHGDTRAAHHRRGPRHPRGRHRRGAGGGRASRTRATRRARRRRGTPACSCSTWRRARWRRGSRSLAALSEEERSAASRASDDLDVSPSNRFVSWAAHEILHDRQTGRTYARGIGAGSSSIEWWGTGPGERLLFRLASSGAFVAMDAELRPVARFDASAGRALHQPRRRLHPHPRVRRM